MSKKFFTDESLTTLVEETKSYVDGIASGKSDSDHTHPVDSDLSTTSTNPVQNQAITNWLANNVKNYNLAFDSNTGNAYLSDSNVSIVADDDSLDLNEVYRIEGRELSPDWNYLRNIPSASTSSKGVVQLTNSTSSTSTTTAATPNSVKSAYDLANTAKTTADGKANANHTHDSSAITYDAGGIDNATNVESAILGLVQRANTNYTDLASAILDLQGTLGQQIADKADLSHYHSAADITSGTLSSDRLPTVPIAKGGTGATTVDVARTNLGVYSTTEVDSLFTNVAYVDIENNEAVADTGYATTTYVTQQIQSAIQASWEASY